MSAQVIQVDFGGSAFEVEVIDESEGEVLTFTDPAVFAEYEAAETAGRDFDHPSVVRRVIELRDQLLSIAGELEIILSRAA